MRLGGKCEVIFANYSLKHNFYTDNIFFVRHAYSLKRLAVETGQPQKVNELSCKVTTLGHENLQMKQLIYLSVAFMLFTLPVASQSTFTATNTFSSINKNTSFGTLHDYLGLKNLTADTLAMRWEVSFKTIPSAWSMGFTDTENVYDTVNDMDVANFLFPDSTDKVHNKMIIGIHHNNTLGSGRYIFNVFDVNHPADSLQLIYDVTVTPHPLSIQNLDLEKEPYPNPSSHWIRVPNVGVTTYWQMLDVNGVSVNCKYHFDSDQLVIETDHLARGSYFIRFSTEVGNHVKKIIVL